MNKYLHSLAQKREILEYSNVNDNVNVPIMSGNERETNIRHLLPGSVKFNSESHYTQLQVKRWVVASSQV